MVDVTKEVVDWIEQSKDELKSIRARLEKSEADLGDRAKLVERLESLEKTKADWEKRVAQQQALSMPGLEVADHASGKLKDRFSYGRMAKACLAPGLLKTKEFGLENEVHKQMWERYDELPNEVKAQLSGASGESGAYLVPTEVYGGIVDELKEVSVFRGLGATVLSGLNGNVEWVKNRGGIKAQHINTEENEKGAEVAAKFARVSMKPHVAACFVPMSWEMQTQTAMPLDNWVKGQIADQIALLQDEKCFLGAGTQSEPLGLLNRPALALTATPARYETWNSSGTDFTATPQTVTDRLINMIKTVRKALILRGKLGWAGSPDAIYRIMQLKNSLGNLVFTDGKGGFSPTLMNYPWKDSQLLDGKNPGDSGATAEVLVFGAWDQAVIGEWGTMAFAMSSEARENFYQLRVTLRGVLAWDFGCFFDEAFCRTKTFPE